MKRISSASVCAGGQTGAASRIWSCHQTSRGAVIVENGKLSAERGRGRFLAREPSEALRPLGRDVPEMAQLKAWKTPLEL